MPVLVAGERGLKHHLDCLGQLEFVRAIRIECRVLWRAGLPATTPHPYFSYFVNLFRKHVFRRLEMIPYMNLNEQVDADFARER